MQAYHQYGVGSRRVCKLQKMVHSTHSRKWSSLPVACTWSVVLSGYSGFFHL